MKKVDSILNFCENAIINKINYELAKVMENLVDPNTDEKARKLTIDIDITPINNRSQVTLKTTVKKKLSATNSVITQMSFQKSDNLLKGFEMTGIPDGQRDIFGETKETSYIEIETNKEEKENIGGNKDGE